MGHWEKPSKPIDSSTEYSRSRDPNGAVTKILAICCFFFGDCGTPSFIGILMSPPQKKGSLWTNQCKCSVIRVLNVAQVLYDVFILIVQGKIRHLGRFSEKQQIFMRCVFFLTWGFRWVFVWDSLVHTFNVLLATSNGAIHLFVQVPLGSWTTWSIFFQTGKHQFVFFFFFSDFGAPRLIGNPYNGYINSPTIGLMTIPYHFRILGQHNPCSKTFQHPGNFHIPALKEGKGSNMKRKGAKHPHI